MQLAMAMYNSDRDVQPGGGGFIGLIILVTHAAVSYSFTRPRRRRERVWPSVCVYRLFVAVCACGIAWGVALAIWDIMIASGQYYKAMADGDTVQAFFFMEAALGIMMSCVCTTSVLLVYHACRCDGPGAPRKRVTKKYNHRRNETPNTISREVDLNSTAVTSKWNHPRLPEGEAPPIYTDSAISSRQNQGHVNPSFNTNEYHIQQPSQWI